MSGEGVIPVRNVVMTKRVRRGTIICPVCRDDAAIRHSEQITDLVKHFLIHCQNTGCGHTWKAQMSFVYTISPSAIERPDLVLPQAPAEYVRHIYPSGPPAPVPDPNQFTMFDDEADAAPSSAAA